jgi:hypothetical protein
MRQAGLMLWEPAAGEAAARVRGQAHPVQEPANAVAAGLLAVPEPWLGQNRVDRHGRVQ